MKEIIINRETAGGRLDKIVCKYLDKAPKSFVYKMLRKKNIVLNDRKAAGNELLKAGDSIKLYLADDTIVKFRSRALSDGKTAKIRDINLSDSETANQIGKDNFLDNYDRDSIAAGKLTAETASNHNNNAAGLNPDLIAFEDDNLLAVNKPAGLLSQKAKPEDRSLNEMVADYLKNVSSEFFTPGVSNRLDRNTSGLVLAGKNLYASRELNRAIRERDVKKYYLCLVKGCVKSEQTIDGYLIKDEANNRVKILQELPDRNSPEKGSRSEHAMKGTAAQIADDRHASKGTAGQLSYKNRASKEKASAASRILTAYQPLWSNGQVTLLKVDLITGKSHQIRAHLASIGHPIIGDTKYGDAKMNKEFRADYDIRRQLLHAYEIQFAELEGDMAYLNGTKIHAPLPEDFERVLQGLKMPVESFSNQPNRT